MIEPHLAAKAISDVSNAVGKGFDVLTTGMSIYRDAQARQERAQVRAEDRLTEATRDEEMRRRELEDYVRHRRDQRADLAWVGQSRLARDDRRDLRKSYPLAQGPGSLRSSVDLLDLSSLPDTPLVLLTPATRMSDKVWENLFWQLRGSLAFLEDRGLAVIRHTDKWMDWPHPALIAHDLSDISSLVVSVEVVYGNLQLRLGGCNLGGKRIRPLSQVFSSYVPDAAYFTDEIVTFLEQTASDNFRAPAQSDTRRTGALQREWAVRLAVLSVVAAVDVYHLIRSSGYVEQIDEVLGRIHPTMPVLQSLPHRPLENLRDPALHLLQHARRARDAGDLTTASELVAEALHWLSDSPDSGVVDALTTAWELGTLQSWHLKLLEELRAQLPTKARNVLRSLPELDLPPTDGDDGNAPLGDTPAAPAAKVYVGRRLRETRAPGQLDPTRTYANRPLRLTRGDGRPPETGD